MPLTTPDGRYIVVKGRLWRAANPHLPDDVHQKLVKDLMSARRAVATALHNKDAPALKTARQKVNAAKCALGERGPTWWKDDGTPDNKDYNRHLIKNTPYARWYQTQTEGDNSI